MSYVWTDGRFLYAWEKDGVWHGMRFDMVEAREEPTDRGEGARTLCGVVPEVGSVARINKPITCMECLLADVQAISVKEEVAV